MPIIDADTHVDENDETWEYLDEEGRRFKPLTVIQEVVDTSDRTPKGKLGYWLFDGFLRRQAFRDDRRTGTTLETRELTNVRARLAHMDELGVDVHVMYPTAMLDTMTTRPEAELALFKAYNRWLAAKWKESDNRLRWVALAPMLSMEKALEELHFAKANGACGVLKRGLEYSNRPASDPYFFPIYEEAQKLGLPICIHTGQGDTSVPALHRTIRSIASNVLPVLDAFHSLAVNHVADKFPDLRVGFIEATASWLPFLVSYLTAHGKRQSWMHSFDLKKDLLRYCRFYVACQTQDDLPSIIDLVGEDNLVIGSDYTHADVSAELQFVGILAKREDIDPSVRRKILDDNPRALYGI